MVGNLQKNLMQKTSAVKEDLLRQQLEKFNESERLAQEGNTDLAIENYNQILQDLRKGLQDKFVKSKKEKNELAEQQQ